VKRVVREAFRCSEVIRAFGADFVIVVREAAAVDCVCAVRSNLERGARQMASRRWIRADEKDATLRHRGV
jgi:RNase P protein component